MDQPLTGRHILLTRDTVGNRQWADHFAQLGAETYSLATIKTSTAELTPGLRNALNTITSYDWLVFTSAAGVRHCLDLLASLNISITDSFPSIAVVGAQTAAAAQAAGLRVTFQPSHSDSAALGTELTPVSGKRVLWLHTDIAPLALKNVLQERGAAVTDLAVYHTRTLTAIDPACSEFLRRGEAVFLVFASPSAVRGFMKRLPPDALASAKQMPSVAAGSSVANALREHEFGNITIAADPTVDSIALAIQSTHLS